MLNAAHCRDVAIARMHLNRLQSPDAPQFTTIAFHSICALHRVHLEGIPGVHSHKFLSAGDGFQSSGLPQFGQCKFLSIQTKPSVRAPNKTAKAELVVTANQSSGGPMTNHTPIASLCFVRNPIGISCSAHLR